MSLLIIGIGNKYRSDDAVGLEIADSLNNCKFEGCTIQKTAGEGIALINLWEDFQNVILIDAVKSGSQPGHIHKIDLSTHTIETDWFQSSSHLFALPEAVQLAKTISKLPKNMIVYGIEGANFEYGEGLTDKVQAAKDDLFHIISSEIKLHAETVG